MNMKKKQSAKRKLRRVLMAAGLLGAFIPGLLSDTTLHAQMTTSIDREQESEESETPGLVPVRRGAVKTKISLEIEKPPGIRPGEADENTAKMLDQFVRIALAVNKRNKKGTFNPFSEKARQRISRLLAGASKNETDDCYKQYLEKLSENVLEKGNFRVNLPLWTSLEENRLEIIFPEDERYGRNLLIYKYFFNN